MPRLTGRFALYAALALLTAAVSTFLFVRREAIQRAEQTARFHTKFVADAILRDHLRPQDLRAPVTAARRRELDELFRDEILVGGSVRASILGVGGRITYSTDHALIGSPPDDSEKIQAAGRGALISTVTDLGAEDGTKNGTKVLETYVPLRLGPSARGAVFDLLEAYAPIASSAQQMFVPLTLVLALVLLALYASFFPILRRVAARVRSQMDQIEHQAFHDALTGLPNRSLFHDRVEQALRAARRHGGTVAVMVMDLDRFKEINDTLGHSSGDGLLREVAMNLSRPLRESDTVARLGGDEFAILAPAVGDALGAAQLAERALAELRRPHEVSGVEVDVVASVGIALYPHHGDEVDTLLRRADIAMYVSKDCGAPTVYSSEHEHHSADQLALVAQLRRAIAQREITVYYQPQADVRTGRVRSVEALVRWEHPSHGLLAPDRFIPHTGCWHRTGSSPWPSTPA